MIPQVTDATTWAALTTGAWCYFNNDSTNGTKYGKLYNWYAVNDARGLAPQGWHIPSEAEWITLSTLLGGNGVAGGKMKETGTLNWMSPNKDATNESGFSGLPGARRENYGTFNSVDTGYGFWWTATETSTPNAWSLFLYFGNGYLTGGNSYKFSGFSVRCVRD